MPAYDPQTALIVVDIQNDFAHPDGSLYVRGAEQVVVNANRAIAEATDAGALVVYTQDWHPADTPHFEKDGGIWPVHCVGDTWGAQFHDELISDAGPVVRKGVDGNDGYSGFTTRDPQSGDERATDLEDTLLKAEIERCVVVGLATDYCVKETVLDACRQGFEVLVPTNSVAAVNLQPADGDAALTAMSEAGAVIE
ncbi:MAG: isochorismatase family protein [Chloroflexi bacterium]|nr:isochorismatase family protein [Chloroflexota bacterium]MXX48442.1 isochorismatase family protein [Chloroflexota bacterium]